MFHSAYTTGGVRGLSCLVKACIRKGVAMFLTSPQNLLIQKCCGKCDNGRDSVPTSPPKFSGYLIKCYSNNLLPGGSTPGRWR